MSYQEIPAQFYICWVLFFLDIEEISLAGRVGIWRINAAELIRKRSWVANSYPYPASVDFSMAESNLSALISALLPIVAIVN